MTYETIVFEVTDQVGLLTLNRPEQLNAWTWRMGAEMSDVYSRVDEDDDVRALVVTGAGRAYCAGADLASGKHAFSGGTATSGDSPPPPQPQRREMYAFEVRKPVIAAMNGHAIGVGMTMSMQMDIRIMCSDAKYAFAFVRRGVLPELGSHTIVPRVAGLSNATELLLTGRTFSGDEALRIGIASQSVAAADVLPAAMTIARDIAVNTAPVSVATSKRLIWEGLTESVHQTMTKEHRLFGYLGRQPDAAEGVMAFLEKRDPAWSLSPTQDFPRWPA